MLILFTPAGDTDPVRNYHDGAILHILRHYPVDKVILFLPQEMDNKERQGGIYTRGIHHVKKDIAIEYVHSGIKEPQDYDELQKLVDAFDKAYHDKANEGAEWVVNISSGTPQIKSIMAIIGIDYPKVKSIQVLSPERASNKKAPPCKDNGEGLDMLEVNEDDLPEAPNRCIEPSLYILHRYGLRLQIESLVRQYEYAGALQILRPYVHLFHEDTEKLLEHGKCRLLLKQKEANKAISKYNGHSLVNQSAECMEYFRMMEIQQKKGNLAEFIIKLSPILMTMGKKYIEDGLRYPLSHIGVTKKQGQITVKKEIMEKEDPEFLIYLQKQFAGEYRDGNLKFIILLYLAKYLFQKGYSGRISREKQEEINTAFSRLRIVEEKVRNKIAHTMMNINEEDLKTMTQDATVKGMSSREILALLRRTIETIYGVSITDELNSLNKDIINSMKDGNV